MTGEVKRYAFYDRHTGCQVDPTEILPGDTTNDDTFIANADHLAVVEGLRADAERYRWLRKARDTLSVLPFIARFHHGVSAWNGEHADAAIDEAMRGGASG